MLAERTVDTVLRLVTAIAGADRGAATGAGLTVEADGSRATSAATDDVVERTDRLQYELGEGPC